MFLKDVCVLPTFSIYNLYLDGVKAERETGQAQKALEGFNPRFM